MVPLAMSVFGYNLSILHDADLMSNARAGHRLTLLTGVQTGGSSQRVRASYTPGKPEVAATLITAGSAGKTELPVQGY